MADDPNLAQRLLAPLAKPVPAVAGVTAVSAGSLAVLGVKGVHIAVGVLVLLFAIGIFLLGIWFMKRKQRSQVDSAISGMSDSIVAQDNSPQARERCTALRSKWERLFRNPNLRPDYLREKPILMIVGESKSGKSVLLDRSGLELESDNRQLRDWEEGTENVDPWFFPEGLVLDTAGEMVAPAAGSARIDWHELVKLIKKMRPRNPVSGIVLAVPVWRLLHPDENARIVQAGLFQREFQRLVQGFGVRFPVSVVVTMSDLIDGFTEFALRQNASRPGDSYTMFGWSRFKLMDEFGAPEAMNEAVSTVGERIEAQVLHDTCNPEVASVERREALEIWCFPGNLRKVAQRLADYLRLVFKEKQSERVANAPFFRGIFFGSAMQTIRKGEPRRKEPEKPSSDPFHIRDLLAIRLFGEAGLVTTSPRAEAAARYRRLIGVVVPSVAATIAFCIAAIAFSLAGHVSRNVAALQDLALAVDRPDSELRRDVAASAGLDPGRKRDPWISQDGEVSGVEVDALAKSFSEAIPGDADASSGLPWYLVWYRPFEMGIERERQAAVHRAWEELVAEPVLRFAASDRGLPSDGSTYRNAPLESVNGAKPSLNQSLSELDRAMFLALQRGMPRPAEVPASVAGTPGAAPQPTPTVGPFVLAKPGEAWTRPEADDRLPDLGTVLEASRRSDGAGLSPEALPSLVAWPRDWNASQSVSDLAGRVNTQRENLLREKLKQAVAPLLTSRDAMDRWSSRDDRPLPERWKDFVQGCLTPLGGLSLSPKGRLEGLAGYVAPAGSDLAAFLRRVDETSFPNSQKAKEAVDGIQGLEAFHAISGDLVDRGSHVVTATDLLQDFTLLARELPRLTVRPVMVDGKEDTEKTGKVMSNLSTLLSGYYGALASRLSEPLGAMPDLKETYEDSPVRLSPIAVLQQSSEDAGKHLELVQRTIDGLNADKKSVVKLDCEIAFNAAADRAIRSLEARANDVRTGLNYLPSERIDELSPEQVQAVVVAVLQLDSPARAVDELAKALATQARYRQADPSVKNPVEPEPRKKARVTLRNALDWLHENSKTVPTSAGGPGSDSRLVAATAIAWNAMPGPAAEEKHPVEAAIDALEEPSSPLEPALEPAERKYWQMFWRDLLGLAAGIRKQEQDEFKSFASDAARKFPLSKVEALKPGQPAGELSIHEVISFAEGKDPRSRRDALPRVPAAEDAPTVTRLRDVWNNMVSAPDAIVGQPSAAELARLLQPPPGMVRDLELRTHVRLGGDYAELETLEVLLDPAKAGELEEADEFGEGVFATLSGRGQRLEVSMNQPESSSWEESSASPGQAGNGFVLAIGRPTPVPRPLGESWFGLRLATMLSLEPASGRLAPEQVLVKDAEGFEWGLIDLQVDTKQGPKTVVMHVGIKVEWVGKDQEGKAVAKTVPVEGWREKWAGQKPGG